jgi:alpha-tubulin suppressor-like RCC1 family protein
VQSGEDFTCTETNEKEIYCWGANESGQLGDGTGTDSLKPKLLEGVSSVQKLSAASKHACAAIGKFAAADGGPTSGVFCWGRNDGLQLGQPKAVEKTLVPTLVPKVEQVKVFTGERHTCALGTPLVCWGTNDKGQLGDGTQTDRDEPTPVNGLTNAAGISAGKGHTCAITGNEPNFQLFCWGANDQGQVGRDPSTKFFTKPEFIDFGAPVTEASARFNHTCAVSNGDLYCWGANESGQLGDGTTEPRSQPFKVPL